MRLGTALLSAGEAAAHLGCSPSMLLKMAKPDFKPAAKRIEMVFPGPKGCKYGFRREDLDRHKEMFPKKPRKPVRKPGEMRLDAGQQRLAESCFAMARGEVRKYRQRWKHGGVIQEIESAAMLGLVYAASSYDPSRGTKFSTHANLAIKSAILNYFEHANRECSSSDRLFHLSGDDLDVLSIEHPWFDAVDEADGDLCVHPSKAG